MVASLGHSPPHGDRYTVAVVGAGLAGLGTVAALRDGGFTGDIVLVGAERHLPYDRPPLSKAVLLTDSGTQPPSLALPFDPDQLEVDVRLNTPARGWRPGAVLTDGGEIGHDALVVATGSEPIRLPGAGGQYLRTWEDALALRSALRPDARVVVVGAGWIGAEVATAARRQGARVTVLERARTPVAQALPPWLGALMEPWYATAGVELVCETTVRACEPDRVVLADGQELPADVIVVGVGVRAADGWLADTALEPADGVRVGSDLRVAGTSHVWAVGDVAARWSPRYGTRIRGEHWDDALRAPAAAVSGVLGTPQDYDPVPYVWSEQFGRMVQYAGKVADHGRTVWRGDPSTDATWSVMFLEGERVVGVLAVDRPRDFVQARRLADADALVDEGRLAAVDVPVKAARVG